MKYVRSNALSKILSDIRRGLKKETQELTAFEKRQLHLQQWTLGAIALTLGCYVWLGHLQSVANKLYRQSYDLSLKTFRLSHVPWVASDRVILPTKDSPVLYLFFKDVGDSPAFVSVDTTVIDQSGRITTGKPHAPVTWLPGETYFETVNPSGNYVDPFISGIMNGTLKVRAVITTKDVFNNAEILDETYAVIRGQWCTESSVLSIPKEYLPQ